MEKEKIKKALRLRFNFLKSRSRENLGPKTAIVKLTVISRSRAFFRLLKNYFLTGLLLFIPIFITIAVLLWVFNTVDGVLQEPIEWAFGRYYDGIGFALTLLLIIIFGIVGSRVAGRNVIRFMEFHLMKIPVIRELYNGIKQIIESFSQQESGNFVEVVFIEFPRKGTFTPALVTNEAYDESGRKMLNIYVPTAPNPTSGFLQILPEDQVVRTTMTVDECMKMVISAGKFSHVDVCRLKAEDMPELDEPQSLAPRRKKSAPSRRTTKKD